ncbi:MAG: PEGA domain-containing protein [Luteitalea sp.]|nr:PEGA domain-containing protein [Luteitalea sp.]
MGTAQRRAPDYARPSTGRAVVGHAVPRGRVPGGGGGGSTIIVRPRTFYPWGLGWGGGYFYDPFWFGAGYWDPLWGPSWGGYSGYGGGPGYWGGGPGYYGGHRAYEREDRGALRLKMKPRQAEVFIEGDFVGQVDDYDGAFQRLRLPPGRHRVQVRADGYEPLEFSVLIVRDQTVTYRGELEER